MTRILNGDRVSSVANKGFQWQGRGGSSRGLDLQGVTCLSGVILLPLRLPLRTPQLWHLVTEYHELMIVRILDHETSLSFIDVVFNSIIFKLYLNTYFIPNNLFRLISCHFITFIYYSLILSSPENKGKSQTARKKNK